MDYQPQIFWKDIPVFVSVPEHAFRVAVLLAPVMMPLSLHTRAQRAGLVVYSIGTLLYFLSWAALILSPTSAWSRSAIGFMGPTLTPALWLTGIGLVGDRLFISRVRYRRWMYGVVAAGFLLFHNVHSALVFVRT